MSRLRSAGTRVGGTVPATGDPRPDRPAGRRRRAGAPSARGAGGAIAPLPAFPQPGGQGPGCAPRPARNSSGGSLTWAPRSRSCDTDSDPRGEQAVPHPQRAVRLRGRAGSRTSARRRAGAIRPPATTSSAVTRPARPRQPEPGRSRTRAGRVVDDADVARIHPCLDEQVEPRAPTTAPTPASDENVSGANRSHDQSRRAISTVRVIAPPARRRRTCGRAAPVAGVRPRPC